MVKKPDVHATSPDVPLYRVPIAEADGTKSMDDAKIERVERTRSDFFILDSFSEFAYFQPAAPGLMSRALALSKYSQTLLG
jgi:hypothetical protein